MLQGLSIALAQVKAVNTFESLLNGIRKMTQMKLLKKYITI